MKTVFWCIEEGPRKQRRLRCYFVDNTPILFDTKQDARDYANDADFERPVIRRVRVEAE